MHVNWLSSGSHSVHTPVESAVCFQKNTLLRAYKRDVTRRNVLKQHSQQNKMTNRGLQIIIIIAKKFKQILYSYNRS